MTTLYGSGPLVMVDDNEIDVDLMRRCHAKSAVPNAFLSFGGGQAFLDHIELVRTGEAEMPALVLLDINMPGLSGFAMLERLRAMERFATLPVVMFLSNSDNPADHARASALASSLREKFVRTADAVQFLNSLMPDAAPTGA